jgi:LacI family transcriptional regulator
MTVREIAELANVSIGTVDRVLYHRGRVSAATKKRIEDIIERYQFTPNPVARSLKRNRPYRFCALLPRRNQDSGYWEQVLDGMHSSESIVAPLGVETEIIEYDRYNIAAFHEAAAIVLDKKPDGLIFAPLMPDTTRYFITQVQTEGIPYIFIDADVPGLKPLCVIGQDPFKGGYFAGKLMRLFSGATDKTIAVLDAHGEDYHIRQRRDGFLRYCAEHSMPTVVDEYSGCRGTELPTAAVEAFLGEHRNLAGIFVTNSMVHRVAEVLRTQPAAAPPDFFVIGYDLIPANRRFLQEGGISAIISQHPEEQGRQALLNLYRSVVLDQEIVPKIDIPINVYMKENIPPENYGNL